MCIYFHLSLPGFVANKRRRPDGSSYEGRREGLSLTAHKNKRKKIVLFFQITTNTKNTGCVTDHVMNCRKEEKKKEFKRHLNVIIIMINKRGIISPLFVHH